MSVSACVRARAPARSRARVRVCVPSDRLHNGPALLPLLALLHRRRQGEWRCNIIYLYIVYFIIYLCMYVYIYMYLLPDVGKVIGGVILHIYILFISHNIYIYIFAPRAPCFTAPTPARRPPTGRGGCHSAAAAPSAALFARCAPAVSARLPTLHFDSLSLSLSLCLAAVLSRGIGSPADLDGHVL